jgi:hypothetical protein
MAAEVEDALGRRIDFLIRSDVEAMKDVEAKNLILKDAVTVYVPDEKLRLTHIAEAYLEAHTHPN